MDHVIAIARPDEEHLEIFVDDVEVGTFDHDRHGWDGMKSAETLVLRIADQLGLQVAEVESQ